MKIGILDYIDPRRVALLVHGHTHQLSMTERENMLTINPGTVSGVRAKTCAVYDTGSRKAEIIER